jgi:hypothetical protein
MYGWMMYDVGMDKGMQIQFNGRAAATAFSAEKPESEKFY